MITRDSPTVRRRRLGMELRRLREAAGFTIERVARALEVSDSKVSRIETGQVGATPRDVRDLLELYGVNVDRQNELIQIARNARQKGWWQAFGDVPTSEYIGFEAAAALIRTYEPLSVPGLLQSTVYARAIIKAARPHLQSEQIERWVQFRQKRQQLFTQDDPPELWAVLDEGVLHRPVGGDEAMREQFDRLLEAAGLPHVTLQVLPFAAGEHAAMSGSFTIFRFDESSHPDIVHLENATSDLYLERDEEIRHYTRAFEQLSKKALDPDDSVAFIAALAKIVLGRTTIAGR